ncbi:MAG: hypothetical protein V2A61_01225 [Calditrichota bacterium]
MRTDTEFFDQVMNAIKPYRGKGRSANREKGLVTTEVLRAFLLENGLNVSPPQVHISGLKHESKRLIAFDLLILKPNINAFECKLFSPKEIKVVLEIKLAGSYDRRVPIELKKRFDAINLIDRRIQCWYLTVGERLGGLGRKPYIYAVKEVELGYPVFTLFNFRDNIYEEPPPRSTGEWQRFVAAVEGVVR